MLSLAVSSCCIVVLNLTNTVIFVALCDHYLVDNMLGTSYVRYLSKAFVTITLCTLKSPIRKKTCLVGVMVIVLFHSARSIDEYQEVRVKTGWLRIRLIRNLLIYYKGASSSSTHRM
jgi:hypothetical protein